MMAGDKQGEKKIDQTREAERKPEAAKLSDEGVTDEAQAQRYERKFVTFSGMNDQKLPALQDGARRSGGDTSKGSSQANVYSAGADESLGLLMRLLESSKQQGSPEATVSELTIEDAKEGREYTARGVRHVTRQSYKNGLRAIRKSDIPTHEDSEQADFSCNYMQRKFREWCAEQAVQLASALALTTKGAAYLLQQGRVEPAQDPAVLPVSDQGAHQGALPSNEDTFALLSAEPTVLCEPVGSNTSERRRNAVQDAPRQIAEHLVRELKRSPDSMLIASNTDSAKEPKQSDAKPTNPLLKWIYDTTEKVGSQTEKYLRESGTMSGEIQEVPSLGSGVLGSCKSLIDDQRREKGEFNIAFGRKGKGPLTTSHTWYSETAETPKEYPELHFSMGVIELAHIHKYQVNTTLHSHPGRKNFAEFSAEDVSQANALNVKSFLLLPAAGGNKLLMYSPDMNVATHEEAIAQKRIVELGHFANGGRFIPAAGCAKQLKEMGFIQ
jgi:hypothetical protein